eukprot:UN09275
MATSQVTQTCRFGCGVQVLLSGEMLNHNNGVCSASKRGTHHYQEISVQIQYAKRPPHRHHAPRKNASSTTTIGHSSQSRQQSRYHNGVNNYYSGYNGYKGYNGCDDSKQNNGNKYPIKQTTKGTGQGNHCDINDSLKWTCNTCTFDNAGIMKYCEICNRPKEKNIQHK